MENAPTMKSLKVIPLTKKHTASLDVDAQRGFTPICPNELPVPEGDQIVDELNLQATKARLRIGSKDAHCLSAWHIATPEKPQFSEVGTPNTDIRWNKHCIMGTDGARLLPGLPLWSDYDFFVFKGIEPDAHPYGACFHDLGDTKSTGLIEYLRQNGITWVIVGGLATDFCVLTTVLQLRNSGFQVVLNLGACRGIGVPKPLFDGDSTNSIGIAIETMRKSGVYFVNTANDLDAE